MTRMTTVYVVNGPNLNLLGTRKPEVYGSTTAAQLEAMCRAEATALGLELDFRQSNHEGRLVDWLQEIGAEAAAGRSVGAVLNPGAYAHTSVAIRDAIESARTPVIECHISNVHAREPFRHHSYVSAVALGVLAGFGVHGYRLAMRGLVELGRAG
jgi:3-dehydroquinate dehydratase-2